MAFEGVSPNGREPWTTRALLVRGTMFFIPYLVYVKQGVSYNEFNCSRFLVISFHFRVLFQGYDYAVVYTVAALSTKSRYGLQKSELRYQKEQRTRR